MSGSEVLTKALELPDPERARLAWDLLLSLEDEPADADWNSAWAVEIAARRTALQEGRTSARDWREAMAGIREKL
jgi:hypothetical protein